MRDYVAYNPIISQLLTRYALNSIPLFSFSLGEANRQKVKFAKMALNHLQEPWLFSTHRFFLSPPFPFAFY